MSYAGEKVKIPLGEFGLLTDIAPDKAPPNSLINAKNVSFQNGTIQKAPGVIKWNSSALPASVVAVHDWWPDTVTQRMIAVTSAGAIYKGRDRQFGSALNTGLGALTPNCVFAEGGAEAATRSRKLFLFTGGLTNPYVLTADGTAFAAIASPNTDWTVGRYPKFGVIHRGSLWAFAGQFSYMGDSANHENFASNTTTYEVYAGEGGELRGAFVYKGRLFAFKDGGFVYALIDEDVDSDNWFWQKVASNFGLSAPNAIDEVLDDLFAGNTTGTITSYAATQKLGNIEAADLVQQLQFESHLRTNASKNGLAEQHMLYYAEKKWLFATYRSAYLTYNDMLIVFDFSREQVTRPSYWVKGNPNCLASYLDVNQIERPMYGDRNGFVMLMDREDRSEGGTAYTGDFQLQHIDFSHVNQALGGMEKHFDFLQVHYIPESSGDLSCDYFIDGRYIDTITFPMIRYTPPELNVLVLGTDRLRQANQETATRKLACSGKTFSARFYNAGNNQSFQIAAVTVMFRPGSEKDQQTG